MKCPVCGVEMRQTRRGATLVRRGPAYVCPQAEAEVERDERGHLRRIAGAIHDRTRVYEAWDGAVWQGYPANEPPVYWQPITPPPQEPR